MMIIVDVINGVIYAESEADPRCRQLLADGRVRENMSFRTGTKLAR